MYIQTADCCLDADFPNGDSTDPDTGHVILDFGSGVFSQPPIVFDPPDENVRIEKKLHGSIPNAAAISGGNGSSKFLCTRIRPLRRPGLRSNFFFSSGTSRAAGFPALAMIISSPPAASSTS